MTIPAWQVTTNERKKELETELVKECLQLPSVGPDVKDVTSIDLSKSLSPFELRITALRPEILLAKLSRGELTSLQVTDAFIRRAVIAHSLINCLCSTFFDRARSKAKALDEYFEQHGPIGALHGLPISSKNQIDVEGEQMDMCYVGWKGRVSASSSAMARLLEAQGAVLYCHTNMSQGLLSSDSVNNLYGRTVSPFNRSLCAGGSSGGEAGLIALRGSCLGVGSDLGGSVRMPAAFNGLYGLRPSSHRMPYSGAQNSQQGQESNASVLGPISRSCAGLKVLFKAILDAEPWHIDPQALRMSWNQARYELSEHDGTSAKLCFGLMRHNGDVVPDPPYGRAMDMVQEALRRAGHDTVEVQLPDAAEGHAIYLAMLTADGGRDLKEQCDLSGEPVLGGTVKGIIGSELSAHQWWKLTSRRREYITTQLRAWESTAQQTGTGRPVDAIICPAAPYPSFRHGDAEYVFYTAMMNVCDYPTIAFPVTTVRSEVDKAPIRDNFLSEWDQLNYSRYDANLFQGMPIGLQLFGRKGEDEAVLRMGEIVDAALGGAEDIEDLM